MSVDTLSDSELRSKLAEYGYPVGPVTQTTRKILVKKLKNLIEARETGFKGSSRHSLAAKYSSDDTDDDSASVNRKKKSSGSSRRQTMANPMPPPAPTVAPKTPSRRRTASRTNSHDVSEPFTPLDAPFNTSSKSVKSITTRKVTRNIKTTSSNDGLETGSDSDIAEAPEKIYSGAKYKGDEAKLYDTSDLSFPASERHVPVTVNYEPINKTYEARKRSVLTAGEDNYVAPAFKLNISPIQAPREPDVYRDAEDPLANVETPFLSDFTRRLSRISTSNLPSRSTLGSTTLRHSPAVPEVVKETDSNGHFSSLRSKYLASNSSSRYNALPAERPAITRTFPSTSDGKELKNNHNLISVILVGVLLLFFIVLAVVYLGLGGKNDDIFSTKADSKNFPFCTTEMPNSNTPGVNCIQKGTEVTTMQLVRRLQSILTEKAISYNCDDATDVPYLTDANIIERFTKKDLDELDLKEDLHNAQLLIFKNPKWGVSLIEVDEFNRVSTDNRIINEWGQVLAKRSNGKVGMVVLNPDVPMKCLVKNKLYTLLTSVLAVAVGALVIIGIHKLVLWHLKQKKESENEVFRLVSEIISKLELHHQNSAVASPGGSQESYLAINHVRDNLILPKNRKKMSSIWAKAVQFLDENESRVRKETQQVAGEEFDVWRWLPSNNPNTSNIQTGNVGSKKTKVWQGQAFETMEGSVNSLPCSPTPCLKIRHMFDADVEFGDDWETKVQDAILEKCGDDVKILHIRVDRSSREGCVYMKCMSQEDAGKAYRALHGWWFDSKLVTVKYLRLERYRERFPDASRCVTPLKPSNNQKLSMQAHNWQSPLETI